MKQGDIIVSVNSENVENDQNRAIELISSFEGDVLQFEIKRNSELMKIDLTPKEEKTYFIGVQFKEVENSLTNKIYYASLNTSNLFSSILKNIKKLISGENSNAQLMGPVGISEVVSKTRSVYEFVYMLAMVSISLGLTNLLPFPPLDGGKILFLIIEAIRKKPIKQEIELQIQLWGFAILIALSIYVTYHDILRFF